MNKQLHRVRRILRATVEEYLAEVADAEDSASLEGDTPEERIQDLAIWIQAEHPREQES